MNCLGETLSSSNAKACNLRQFSMHRRLGAAETAGVRLWLGQSRAGRRVRRSAGGDVQHGRQRLGVQDLHGPAPAGADDRRLLERRPDRLLRCAGDRAGVRVVQQQHGRGPVLQAVQEHGLVAVQGLRLHADRAAVRAVRAAARHLPKNRLLVKDLVLVVAIDGLL